MARKFRFTLETVLRVRKAKEEKVQLEYAALLDKRVRELNELGRLERGREDLNQAEAGARPAKVFAGDVRQYELARLALGEKITWQRHRLALADEALEQKRQELVVATRDRKVLEKIEESQYGAYLEKLNKEEQGFLDELARYAGSASANQPFNSPA